VPSPLWGRQCQIGRERYHHGQATALLGLLAPSLSTITTVDVDTLNCCRADVPFVRFQRLRLFASRP